jgi:hypothetical protein
MPALLILLLVAQTPDTQERVIVIPMGPNGPGSAPNPPPPPPEPPLVFDAGSPAPSIVIEPVPQPAPAPAPQPQPQPPQLPAVTVDAGTRPVRPVPPPPVEELPPEPQQGPVVVEPPPAAEAADAGTAQGGLAVHVGVESGLTSWPSGNPQDLFFDVRPLLSLKFGDAFALDIAPMFHFLLIDDPPVDRNQALGGILRKNDWDELSDLGQIIRSLRIGSPDGMVWLRAGAVQLKTLGLGHLISRYSNQDNPEYHPASGAAGLHIGAVKAEFFASDILGARIFSGLAGLELGRMFSNDPGWYDRFWVTAEIAHDVGLAGGKSPSVTLLHTDVSAVLYRSKIASVQTFVGLGGRIFTLPNWGAVGGFSTDIDASGFLLAGKIEVRKQAGGFRQGFFGPQYEISRFVGAGFSGVAQADQVLPDSYSVYGEVRSGVRGLFVAEGAIEHFAFGRTDFDLSFNAEMFGSRFVTSVRFTGIALGVLPRYAVIGDARFRLFKSFYVLASAGTVIFPQPLGTLTRGIFVSAGVGVDFDTVL